jgi:hypothetical protein
MTKFRGAHLQELCASYSSYKAIPPCRYCSPGVVSMATAQYIGRT